MKSKPTYQELERELEFLREKEKSQKFINLAKIMLVALDLKGNVTYVNKETCEIFGYKEEEFLGKNWFENFIPPRVKNKVRSISKKLLTEGKEDAEYFINPILTVTGDERVIYWQNTIVKDDNGNITGHLSLGEDITVLRNEDEQIKKKKEEFLVLNKEYRETSNALKISEESFRAAFDATQDCIIICDKDYNYLFANQAAISHGRTMSNKDVDKNFCDTFDRFPEFMNLWIGRIDKVFETGEVQKVSDKSEIQGEIVYTQSILSPICNSKNEVVSVCVVYRDITDFKKAEESDKYTKMLFNSSPIGLALTKLTGELVDVNKAYADIIGYSIDEALKLTYWDITPKEYTDLEQEQLKSLKKKKSYGPYEKEYIHKSGKLIPVRLQGKIIEKSGEKYIWSTIEDISEQKRVADNLLMAKEKAEKNGEYFRTMIEQSPIGTQIYSMDGVLKRVNKAWSDIWGVKDVDKVINHFNVLTDQQVSEKGLTKYFKKVFAGEKVDIHETVFNPKISGFEGNKLYVKLRAYPLKNPSGTIDNVVILSEDISKSKQSEVVMKELNEKLAVQNEELIKSVEHIQNINAELEEAQEESEKSTKKYRNLFENNPVSLWEEDLNEILDVLDDIKQIDVVNYKQYLKERADIVMECSQKINTLNINKATLGMLKAPNKEYLINNIVKTFNEKSFEFFIEELEAILLGKTEFLGETELVRFDGEIITVISRMFFNEKTGRMITAVTDITERKKAEKELEIAKKKAEENDRLKTEFINNMSHEIRTPMNGVIGFTGFLSNPDLTEENRANYIKIIQNCGKQLMRIIDDILEISKLGTNQVNIVKEKVCLNNLFLEQFAIFEIRAKENSIPLYLKKGLSNNDCGIITDKTKLIKILSNLLENALKFTDEGYIEFGYNLIKAQKNGTSVENKNMIQIYVKDTGIGIKAEKQNEIFDRFSQEEQGLSRRVGGLGLGLSIAKENARLLGGDIIVESEKGAGTTFYLTIPYESIEKNEIIGNRQSIKNQNRGQEEYRILVVEDEEVNYKDIVTLLESFEYKFELLHAKSDQEAIDMCRENSDINFVLMDLKMPILNGFETARKIKEIRYELPIIAQTAYATPEDREKTILAGCDEFISKPICKESFNKIIKNYIKTDCQS